MADLAAVAGTGKMGRNIGLMLLRAGWRVVWLTRSAIRLESARSEIGRQVRRLGLDPPKDGSPELWSVGLLTDCPPDCAIIIESSSESLPEKIAIALALLPAGNAETLRLSNSSSILPSEIGLGWIGCHFFYPVELNGLVELIIPQSVATARCLQAQTWLRGLGFRCVVQPETAAFAINRLLLPLQAEAMSCLMSGHAPSAVEQASSTSLFPAGMLSNLDSIGLDLVLAAVRNYSRRLPVEKQVQLEPLQVGLELLLQAGFTGKGGPKGLLSGEPLPWSESAGSELPALSVQRFEAIARESVREMVLSGQISRDDLCAVLRDFWNSAVDPAKVEAT